ncbi:MAG: hypothetical protein K6V97_06730 [Actinomycetia bacterium]|nr:hypothetical protein [Actinomycetes bacterium]
MGCPEVELEITVDRLHLTDAIEKLVRTGFRRFTLEQQGPSSETDEGPFVVYVEVPPKLYAEAVEIAVKGIRLVWFSHRRRLRVGQTILYQGEDRF